MRRTSLLYVTAAAGLILAGCSDEKENAPVAPAPAPAAAKVDVGAKPSVTPPGGAPQTTAAPVAAANSEPSEPQLAPVQSAIQAFEEQNKRMPANVQELVDSGAMKNLPPLPTGKIYYIDHATKKVKIGSGP